MVPASDERERPHEWLRLLSEDRQVFRDFVAGGDVLGCAYRMAVARRRVQDRCSTRPIPTLREVDAAVCEIEDRGFSDARLARGRLGEACEERGLLVIAPSTRHAA